MTKKDDKEQINKDVCECNKDCDCAAACVRCVELENNWKRALADYRNLEKRVVEEKAEFAVCKFYFNYENTTNIGQLGNAWSSY